jgi:hypothetical protein
LGLGRCKVRQQIVNARGDAAKIVVREVTTKQTKTCAFCLYRGPFKNYYYITDFYRQLNVFFREKEVSFGKKRRFLAF